MRMWSVLPVDHKLFFKGAAESSYLPSVPQPVAVRALNCLRQLMQDALQKSTSRKTWEQPNGTVVQGPLSWKQLHHLATKGKCLQRFMCFHC